MNLAHEAATKICDWLQSDDDPITEGERRKCYDIINAALADEKRQAAFDVMDVARKAQRKIEGLEQQLAAEKEKVQYVELANKQLREKIQARDKQLAAERENLMKLERDWHKVVNEVLKCNPIPARDRADDQLEPPWEVIARLREQLAAERVKFDTLQRQAEELHVRAQRAETQLAAAQETRVTDGLGSHAKILEGK